MKTKISEVEWAKWVVEIINSDLKKLFPNQNFSAEPAKKLIYAYEIYGYEVAEDYPDGKPTDEVKAFQTDILIFETLSNGWKPRVVIEAKIRGVTTHDAITYSQKAASHKAVHPYLRYGIFIGELAQIPKYLIRHGENFDFMITWAENKPTDKERESFMEIIKQEIEASLQLDQIYGRKEVGKESKKYTSLHRPLVLKPEGE